MAAHRHFTSGDEIAGRRYLLRPKSDIRLVASPQLVRLRSALQRADRNADLPSSLSESLVIRGRLASRLCYQRHPTTRWTESQRWLL